MFFDSSSSLLNKLLAWSIGTGGGGYVRLEFPFNLAWYHEQPCTTFLSFQHRKEPKGLRHEFIVLQMTDGSVCRVERMGDPNARMNAINPQGSIAHDIAQYFRPKCIEGAALDSSIVLAEVHLPKKLDLKDVLNICRAIQEAGKTRKYTLQTFNCFFFSLALQSCLIRLISNWKDLVSYNHEAWKSDIMATARSLASIDISDTNSSLFRVCSFIRPHPHSTSPHPFSKALRNAFHKNTLDLVPQVIVDKVFWYHQIGAQLDNLVIEELKYAWWEAFDIYLKWLQEEDLDSDHNPDDDELKPLLSQCASALQGIISASSARDEQSARSEPRELQPTNPQHLRSKDCATEMDYRGFESDEYEYTKALTISQWLQMFWLYAVQIFHYFVVLLILLWISFSRCPVHIDTELEQIVSSLESRDDTKSQRLSELFQKLRVLCNKHNLVWGELPWTQVKYLVEINFPSSPSLRQESVFIQVALEGQESSQVTVSTFQKHILRRIELQARLVERVGLGRSATISAEIQSRLSLIWATIRNDKFDKDTFFDVSPPSLPPPDPPHGGAELQESKRDSSSGRDIAESIAQTAFTGRIGTYMFLEPTHTNGWVSLVNNWHQKIYGSSVTYETTQTPGSPRDQPVWTAIPIVLGEQNLAYQASGPSKRAAMEKSARLIAASGHC